MSASQESSPAEAPAREPSHLGEVVRLFLRLGFTAFGGPAAHIALMEDEAVTRRKWLTREQFLDLLGIANLLPGPSSSEVAIYLGFKRAGWRGLILGGACFVLPAALIVSLIAWAYVRFGSLPHVAGVLYGVRPVVLVIVLQALWRLGRTALRNKGLIVLGICAAALNIVGLGPVRVLLLCGAATVLFQQAPLLKNRLAALGVVVLPGAGAAVGVTLARLFGVFFKLGFVVFGSGYVLLVFLRSDLIARLHWLTEKQLLDAVAVGQVTPGPVFTTATFIGYLLAGAKGAAIATVAIFLPAFLLVAATGPFISRLRKSTIVASALDGVNAGSLGLMAAVTYFLGRAAVLDLGTALIAVASAVLLWWLRVNSTWVILAAAVAGALWR
jgi:chromate transporter